MRLRVGGRRLRRAVLTTVAAGALLGLGASEAWAAAPSSYTVTPLLGQNATNVTCVAGVSGINDQGYVVGTAAFTGYASTQDPVYAFVWHAGAFTQLPDPTTSNPDSGQPGCLANGFSQESNDFVSEITAKDVILGEGDAAQAVGPSYDVIWQSPTSGETVLSGSGACGNPDWQPEDLNENGEIAGDVGVTPSGTCGPLGNDTEEAAATQSANGAAPQVSVAPSGPCYEVEARQLNDEGQVIGSEECSGANGYYSQSYLWSNGTATQLGLTPGTGGGSFALPSGLGGANGYEASGPGRVLNDSGVVVGWTLPASGPMIPEYSIGGAPALPLELPAGTDTGYADGINAGGEVIGETGSETPTLWPGGGDGAPAPDAPGIDLASLVAPPWKVLSPTAINDSGQIVAVATNTSTEHTQWVILTPGGLTVNSTALTLDDPTSLANNDCNTTPSASTPTCTLPAAIQVANRLGGGTITFNIPTGNGNTFDGSVPQIQDTTGTAVPWISEPTTIDGTSQPGAGQVELSGTAPTPNAKGTAFTNGIQVAVSGAGSTIRGMVINGYSDELDLVGGNDTILDDWLDTDPAGTGVDPDPLGTNPATSQNAQIGVVLDSSGSQIGGAASGQGDVIAEAWFNPASLGTRIAPAIEDEAGVGGNVIQGDWIGIAPGTKQRLALPSYGPNGAIGLSGLGLSGGETVGGAGAGQGNTIATPGSVAGTTVVQGNTIYGELSASGAATIGGATGTPGTGAGNTFKGPLDSLDGTSDLQLVGGAPVVQGNVVEDGPLGGIVAAGTNGATIGGSATDLSNLIENNAAGYVTQKESAGVEITGNDNRIENNILTRDGYGGGHAAYGYNSNESALTVYGGTGNTISRTVVTDSPNGIVLGSGDYAYDSLLSTVHSTLPNGGEYYPILLASRTRTGRAEVQMRVRQSGTVTVEVFGEADCASPGDTPGQGATFLGSHTVSSRFGEDRVTLDVSAPPPGERAVTATVTAADGSTSEFSPCIDANGSAPSFLDGVTSPTATVPLANPTAPASDAGDGARIAKAQHKARAGQATLRLLCPPRTTGDCTGTVIVRTLGPHPMTLTHARFRMPAGFADVLKLTVAAKLVTKLRRTHRIALEATTAAHDGARHRHHVTRRLKLTLVYATTTG